MALSRIDSAKNAHHAEISIDVFDFLLFFLFVLLFCAEVWVTVQDGTETTQDVKLVPKCLGS